MARFWILVGLGVVAALGGVAWYVAPPSDPRGFSGLQFSAMTPGAAARAPLLTSHGALIQRVEEKSPAAEAGLHPGEVVVAIDGVAINSAEQAAGIVRSHNAGDRVTFTLFDEEKGGIHPQDVAVAFGDEPKRDKILSVLPPRTITKERFSQPPMAANAAWSPRLARGPTIRPLALYSLSAEDCSGFAPAHWYVAAHGAEMIHVMASQGFEHAIYQASDLNGANPKDFVLSLVGKSFSDTPAPSLPESQPFGFQLIKFGLPRGAAGFAEYKVTGNRIVVWIAAAAAADIAWAVPQSGAVAFSLSCKAAGATRARDPALDTVSVSTACIKNQCREGDFAAQYMKVLRLGYVHGPDGAMWLIKPKTDFWANGAEGPGYYHQIGGENEKLEPGRTN